MFTLNRGQEPVVGGHNRMSVQHYRQLVGWQKAMELVRAVNEVSDQFPKHEIYGLTSDQTGGRIGSFEYRRGAGPRLDKRISPSSFDSQWLADGGRNSNI